MYKLAEKFLKNQKKLILLMAIFIPIMIIFFFIIIFLKSGLINDNAFNLTLIISIVITIIIIELTIIITSYLVMKNIKNLTIEIHENSLKRINKDHSEEFLFKKLNKIIVYKLKNNDIFSISLSFNDKGKIILHGFENMPQLLSDISSKENNSSLIIEKNKIINQTSAVYLLIVFIASTTLVYFLMQNKNIYDIFQPLLWLLLGTLFIFFRRTSKSLGSKFRNFEIILGVSFYIFFIIKVISLIIK